MLWKTVSTVKVRNSININQEQPTSHFQSCKIKKDQIWQFILTGDCLIEVTAWTGLTVYKYLFTEDNLHKLILYIHHTYFCNGHGIYNLLNICKEKCRYQVIFQSARWTSIKTGGELRCPGRVGSSCSTSGTRRVTLVISNEWGKDLQVQNVLTYNWNIVESGVNYHNPILKCFSQVHGLFEWKWSCFLSLFYIYCH
jgi:hypothetical protein